MSVIYDWEIWFDGMHSLNEPSYSDISKSLPMDGQVDNDTAISAIR